MSKGKISDRDARNADEEEEIVKSLQLCSSISLAIIIASIIGLIFITTADKTRFPGVVCADPKIYGLNWIFIFLTISSAFIISSTLLVWSKFRAHNSSKIKYEEGNVAIVNKKNRLNESKPKKLLVISSIKFKKIAVFFCALLILLGIFSIAFFFSRPICY